MSYNLACGLGHKIAAIASVTGSMNVGLRDSCAPNHPMPVMEIHGTRDFIVAYNGNPKFDAIDSVLDFWVTFNRCDNTAKLTLVRNTNLGDGSTVEHYEYSNCDRGIRVEHFKVIGGSHTWPGSPGKFGVNKDIDASVEIWRFFSQYNLNGPIIPLGIQDDLSEIELNIYPNPASDHITLNLNKEYEQLEISVYNSMGQVVFNRLVQNVSSYTIEMPEHKGLYFLSIHSGSALAAIPVIKK